MTPANLLLIGTTKEKSARAHREELPGRSPIAPGQARLTLEFLRDGLPEKKVATCWYEYLINPIKP